MCGIAGKFDFRGAPVERELIASMCDTIVHRGPDDEGIYTAPYIGLGQRRLAIIDLAHRSVAPLPNEDETVWVTFNGEIYNFRELRARLEERGHRFRTETDTEVIVHLYEEYGTDCVRHMRGMFAFGLWDARNKRFLGARDRLGKKPFFYTRTSSALIFGSEIKAITADPSVSISPNFAAIDSYLTYQYVPSPLTAFDGIAKLPPGHLLTCGVDGDVRVEQYWAAPSGVPPIDASEDEIATELVARLRESVRMRMVSDVPLGAFLSGGVDSATIVALMAQESSRPVKTFSIGFEDQSFNELPYARLVAQRYGTEHHEMIVRPDALEVLPLLIDHYNEPFADSSAVPTYYVSRLTREHVTVALSGDGGDENFAGYDNYAKALRWENADAVPRPFRRAGSALAKLAATLPYTNAGARAAQGARLAAAELPERFRIISSIFRREEKRALYTDKFAALSGLTASLPLAWSSSSDPMAWMMRHDQRYYIPDCLMVKVDVASMANSLEVRAPLLDHEFVEFAARIPSSMKRDERGGKLIFKHAVRDLVPREVLEKPKSGFGIPVRDWLSGSLRPLLRETLLDDKARRRDLFDQRFVARMIDQHNRGQRDWSNRLWALLCLELWFRRFIDRSAEVSRSCHLSERAVAS
jgi:asparagine synthase (glutamine-hydrolysing)